MFLRNLPRGVSARTEARLNNNSGSNTPTRLSSVGGINEKTSFFRVVNENEELELNGFKVNHRYLPIISGLAIPFSVLLDIPGLTEKWYIRTEGFLVVETQPNPIILDIALALSIALGLVANVALIMRFLEKRVKLTTVISIVCLTIHDIINTVVLITFGVIHSNNDGFTYGTAYWLTIGATAASMTANITLMIDLYKTKEFEKHGSGLTEKQRSLVIAVMMLLCYIALGSLVFSFLLDLTYIDSLYFTISTITSVGLGDITPTTLASRLFSFPYDIIGLISLAFTVAIARETIIETFEDSYRRRRDLLASKNRERKMEKAQRVKERRERREQEIRDGLVLDRTNTSTTFGVPNINIGGRGGAASRVQRRIDYEDEKGTGVSSGKAKFNQLLRRLGLMKPFQSHGFGFSNLSSSSSKNALSMERTLTATSINQEQSYVSFRNEMNKEQSKEFRIKIAIALALFWAFWLIGAVVFHFTETWTYFDALYFCFIFFTTIGYGDFAPQTPAGRSFFVAWSILGIATMTLVLSVVTESWALSYRSTIEEKHSRQEFERSQEENGNDLGEITLTGINMDSGETLAEKLRDCAKNFHEHAKYFLFGPTSDIPSELKALIDEPDKLEKDSKGKDGNDAKHLLFMIAYERSLESLLKATEEMARTSVCQVQELETMRKLNHELGLALARTTPNSENSSSFSSIESSKPILSKISTSHLYLSKPIGGYGDEAIEDALMLELDGEIVKGPQEIKYPIFAEGRNSTLATPPVSVNPFDALVESSEILRRFMIQPPTPLSSSLPLLPESIPTTPFTLSPIPISPHSDTSSTLSPYDISRKPSFASIARTPTLTFQEPPERFRNDSTASGSPDSRRRRSSLGGSFNV